MSTTYRAELVCGFQVEIREVKKQVTKFDENTGKPYETSAYSHDVAVADGVEVGTTEICVDALSHGEELEGLEFGSSGGYGHGTKWLGKVVTKVDDYKEQFKEVKAETPACVLAFAQKHGLTPRWFLSLSCS